MSCELANFLGVTIRRLCLAITGSRYYLDALGYCNGAIAKHVTLLGGRLHPEYGGVSFSQRTDRGHEGLAPLMHHAFY